MPSFQSVSEEGVHKATAAAYFSASTEFWEKVYADSKDTGVFYNYSVSKRKSIVLQKLDEHSQGKSLSVLDAGCGAGVVLEDVARRGHSIRGVDLSEKMVDVANRRLAAYVPGVSPCRTADIENLPFDDGSFDAALALGVIMYLPTDHKALSELRRVVRPGGGVILVLPNLIRLNMLFDPYYVLRGWAYCWHLAKKKLCRRQKSLVPIDFSTNRNFTNRRYIYGSLIRLCKIAGFENISVTGVEYGPITLGGNEILPPHVSVSLSEAIAKSGGKFSLLNRLSGQWVVCMTRR